MVRKINKSYPGRASSGPILDLFVTLLEMGEANFKYLYKQRKDNFQYLEGQLITLC